MNPQAEELNQIIQSQNSKVFELLSEKGKAIFFPKKGILGQTAAAKGKKINATIGTANEDDGSVMTLKSLEDQINISSEFAFPYAPSFGRPDLRSKWKSMIYDKNPGLNGVQVSQPVVTNALTHGLSMAAYMFIDQGDEVIVPDLFWGNYNLILSSAYGSTFKKFKFFKDQGMDLDALKNALNSGDKKKILLLNFPNNPSGYTPTVEEMKQVVQIIKECAEAGNKITVISDDAYFGLVYEEGIEMQSPFAYLADLHENVLAVKIDGATKEDYVWGFRVGFITYGIKGGTEELYTALAAKTAGAIRGNISNACNLTQSLLLKAFEGDNYVNEKKEKYDILQARYIKLKEVLTSKDYSDCFEVLPFNSGYFMCLKLADDLDGEAIRQILLEKYSTGIINMAGVIRLAFSATALSLIEELVSNIYNACKDYRNQK